MKVIIVGGGPAGLAAAVALKEKGVHDLLILEREPRLGGILNQCIHDGFGLTRFGKNISGPEYAQAFIDRVQELGIETVTNCTVIDISDDKLVTAVSNGRFLQLQADAVLLTMGCRERPRGALAIPGHRPAGVYTAGVAQSYVNLKNTMVGKNVVILGSGDIGMIMARRLTLEGCKVHAVFELQPYPSGLPRNIEQCLNDFGIPLFLSHTVTRINGKNRLESVTVSQVDEKLQPIPGTEKEWPCDTLILSVGLIPENELSLKAGVELDARTKGAVVDESLQTSVPGIFAAGNVLHVHDLVDFVSLEAEKMADSVTRYLAGDLPDCQISVETDGSIGYTVPQKISGTQDVTLSFRPRRPMENCRFEVWQGDVCIAKKRVPKALPAMMVHIAVKKSVLVSQAPLKVVSCVE